MLYLDSKVDRPDFVRLFEALNESLAEGVLIEIPEDKRRIDEIDQAETAQKLRDIYGLENPNSSKQVIEVLKRLAVTEPLITEHCRVYEKDVYKWTSSKEALTKLRNEGVQFADLLLYYRSICARTKAYNSLEKAQDENGFIHPEVSSQTTNRVSYSNPGLMSIPKSMLWQVVRPRKPGWKIWRIDIKNQEPWIFINKLGITRMQELLKISGDLGLYRLIYNDIYGTLPDDAQYKEIKTAWNALTYGGSKKLLKDTITHMGESTTSVTDNGIKFYEWFMGFPEIKDYHKRIRSMAYGGKRQIETVFGSTIKVESCPPHVASRRLMDYWIQGTGADILAFLVCRLLDYIEASNLQNHIRLYYTRHDEVVIELSPVAHNAGTLRQIEDKLREIFSHTIDDWMPCKLEVECVEPDDETLDEEDEEFE